MKSNILHSEFVADGLTGVIFGKPFKEISGLDKNEKEGLVWLEIGDDKTVFKMPRTVKNFKNWAKKQLSYAWPLLGISEEDKAKGFDHPYQKIKIFYLGCLELGKGYKRDENLISWLQRGDCHIHKMTNKHF